MYSLIIKRRVVIYPQFAAAPEVIGVGTIGRLTVAALTMSATGDFQPFDEECRLRRGEADETCTRKPDESFEALRRAPECPTSRYCLECPEG